jgi:hypothetical protein
MNTRELSAFDDWDESELERLVGRFVRNFRRLPSYEDLVHFHRTRSGLHLRLPAQGRRKVAALIASL